jgi:hypothetical protein
MRSSILPACLMIAVAGLLACGPKSDPQRPRPGPDNGNAAAGTNDERPPPREDGPSISGLMGTIDTAAVEKAFETRINQVRTCRSNHLGSLSYVGGEVTFFFQIGVDGVPTKVVMERSQLGHWALEACLLGVAKGLKFVKPKGGSAEVRYTMSLANEGTDAGAWDVSKVTKTLRPKRRALAKCRQAGKPSQFAITFYVLPQGKVKTAGVTSSDELPAGFAACIAKVILATTFDDPLGEVVRVTYDY